MPDSVRRPTVDSALRRLSVEKLSIGDVQRLEWDALEAKIHRWIRVACAAVRGVFASERRLCFHIFHDLPLCTSTATATAADDAPFAEAVKGAALQLFGFAEAISIGRRYPDGDVVGELEARGRVGGRGERGEECFGGCGGDGGVAQDVVQDEGRLRRRPWPELERGMD